MSNTIINLDEDCLVTIPYKTDNPSGIAYGVDKHEDAFVGFRLYVDKETKVGPDRFDIIWDRAILFTKKKPCKQKCETRETPSQKSNHKTGANLYK